MNHRVILLLVFILLIPSILTYTTAQVAPTLTIDNSVYYIGDTVLVSGWANPDEELSVTLSHATEGNTGIENIPWTAASDGYYAFTITLDDSYSVGTYVLTVDYSIWDNSIAITFEVLPVLVETTLTLDEPPSQVTEGDVVTFTGRLTRDDTGAGIAGQAIYIYDYDGGDDDLLASGTTDSQGYFSIDWIAEDRDVNDDKMETYAYYFGNDDFEPSDAPSNNNGYYQVEVLIALIDTTLTMDPLVEGQTNFTVAEGDVVTFTGRLTRDDTGAGISNELITLYDWDGGSTLEGVGDFLSSAYTNSNGYFTITWTATCMDIVNEEASPEPGTECQAETYSHFAGDSTYDPARSSGGYRTNVITVTIKETTLTLDDLPSEVNEGDVLTITGRLTRTDNGVGISGQTIYIYEYDQGDWNGDGDDFIGMGTTDSQGYFSIDWIAEDIDVQDDVVEIYAYYFGNEQFMETPSNYYYPIEILTGLTTTTLTLDSPISSVRAGDLVTFTGRLTNSNTGDGISGQTIYLYDADSGDFIGTGDDLLDFGTTDSQGYFSINWIAEDVDFLDDIIEVYVYFEGTDELSSSASNYYDVEVVDSVLSTSLVFDEPLSVVNEGDIVTFTGRLTRTDNGVGIAGQTIYIYDYDGGDDDLLASGTTDSQGYFSIDWIAEDRDVNDDKMETYAYYFGNDDFEPSDAPSNNNGYYQVEVLLSKISTTITLDDVPESVFEGTTIVLSGQLTETETNEPISNQLIEIRDFNSGMEDTIIISLYTDQNGYFLFTWESICYDDEDPCTVELYSYFPGTDDFQSSWLQPLYKTVIITTTLETTLIFDDPPSQVTEGDVVTFTGRLTQTDTGAGISGQTIYIYDYDRGDWNGDGDDILAIGVTDSNGYFSLDWVAEDRDVRDDIVESYAYFQTTADYSASVSEYYFEIEILFLDNSPPVVLVEHQPINPTPDEQITFTVYVDDDSGNEGFKEVRLIIDGEVVETWNTLGTHEITVGPFTEGPHTYYVIAEDNNGNLISDPQEGTLIFIVESVIEKTPSVISFIEPVSLVDEGELVQFSGNLVDENGEPIVGVLVEILDFDMNEADDDLLASAITDSSGDFVMVWPAICTDFARDPCILEVYALFSGSQTHEWTYCCSTNDEYFTIQVNTFSVPIQGFAICEGIYCEEHDQTIPNALVWLFWDDGYCSDNPTIDCLNYLFENGNVFELQYYAYTFTDKSGEFIFYDIPITSSSGSPNTFYIVVQLMHESYIDVIDLRESESGITYSKWVGPIFFSSDDSEFIVPVRFTTNDEMSAAAYYTYYVRIFDYFISELGQPEIENYPHLQVKIFADVGCVEREDCGSPHFQPFTPTSSDCFDTSRKDNRGRANYCYVQIPWYALPSANQHSWKDAAAMELIHALHWANGGLRDDGITLMNRWWAENWGTFLAEALQNELNDDRGAQNRDIGYFSTCAGNIEKLTWDRSMNAPYTNYRDPVSWPSDYFAVYCPAASILWDFYDNPSVPDTLSGDNEDDNVSIDLKTLWDLSFANIYSIFDLYNYLNNLDLNLDGIVNSLDNILTEEIFSNHGVPGGIPQE